MRDLNAVIEDYRISGSENRLNLFLSYPRLRRTFIQIERSETPPRGSGGTGVKRPMASIRRKCRALASLFMC